MHGSSRYPVRVVPMVFLAAAAVGTALLMLPISREGDGDASFIAALFTAMSAVCVTGLAVVDTADYWSGFGETVIVVLIQLGGFGIMTMASLLGLLVARRLRLTNRLIAQAESKTIGLTDWRQVIIRVGAITLFMELLIATVLTARFHLTYGRDLPDALWHGIFHAVSAFNNAGFALYPDSMESFAGDPVVILPIAVATIIGGIGTPVIIDVLRKGTQTVRWSLHTKLTVVGTAILLAVGFVVYLVFEWGRASTLGPLGTGDKISVAFFSSVMPRSTGFNAIPMSEVTPETLTVTQILMFIGGGSAGTSGGIKVTTFLLLAFVIWSEIRGEPEVVAFGRTIPGGVQRQALTVALLGVAIVVAATVTVQSLTNLSAHQVLFETISAFGPVGLSTGITPDLPPAAQCVLVALMFSGRVGSVVIATALALRGRPRRYHYPVEQPLVG